VDEFDFAEHYLYMLSTLWVGDAYEICRCILEVNNPDSKVASDPRFRELAHDFRLLRIPLEKHQIAGDRVLSAPLQMQTVSNGDAEPKSLIYDKGDPKRAYIMPVGCSHRGSVVWFVLDASLMKTVQLERRALSD
jgi:hypothetical protein